MTATCLRGCSEGALVYLVGVLWDYGILGLGLLLNEAHALDGHDLI